MLNIIKSQNYQLRHDLGNAITVIVVLAFVIVNAAMNMDVSGGEVFLGSGEDLSVLVCIIILLVVPKIAAGDFNDKTVNYEILSGHRKRDVYLGRFIVSVVWGVILGEIMILLPVAIVTAVNGWGDNVSCSDVIIRMLLTVLPVIRVVAEFFLLAILLRNSYATYALGYVLLGATLLGSLLLGEFFNFDITYVTGNMTLTNLLEVTNSMSQLVNGVDILVYDAALKTKDIILTGGISVLFTALCYAAGLYIFNKRDMQ